MVLAAALFIAPATAWAIVHGAPTADHSAVVALLDDESGAVRCTGTLVAPAVVLTAGHCLVPWRPMTVFAGDSFADGGAMVAVASGHPHPDFQREPLAHDIGMVLLDQPLSVEPAVLGTRAVDALGAAPLELVGFGLSAPGEPSISGKQVGHALAGQVTDTEIALVPDPAHACDGDSGGPVLHEGAVIAVISHGDPACVGDAWAARLDGELEGFVEDFLNEHARPAARSPEGASCSAVPGPGPAPRLSLLVALLVLAGRMRRRSHGSRRPGDAFR